MPLFTLFRYWEDFFNPADGRKSGASINPLRVTLMDILTCCCTIHGAPAVILNRCITPVLPEILHRSDLFISPVTRCSSLDVDLEDSPRNMSLEGSIMGGLVKLNRDNPWGNRLSP